MNPAILYNDVYSWKDYQKEAQILLAELKNMGRTSGSILELACGTGKYLSFFEGWRRTGVDLCPDSLTCAKAEMGDAELICSDMSDTGILDTFDVIICLFGGISYLPLGDRLKAIEHWRSLLKPNGILIVEPWIEEEHIQFGTPFLFHFSCQEYAFSRVVTPRKEDHSCVLEFFFLYINKEGLRQKFYQRDILYLQKHHVWKDLLCTNSFVLLKEIDGFLHRSAVWFFGKHD
ncbi:MAG: hypothetical protein CL916_02215 [Deltaproteobacteria bacterium]|nr:hypothetical protein [Deltaproteobacteria bacterium]